LGFFKRAFGKKQEGKKSEHTPNDMPIKEEPIQGTPTQECENIVLYSPNVVIRPDENVIGYVKNKLMNSTVARNQEVYVNLLGSRIPFITVSISPEGPVTIALKTYICIISRPKKISFWGSIPSHLDSRCNDDGQHIYEFNGRCKNDVCVKCGHHKGLVNCSFCGWDKNVYATSLNDELSRLVTIYLLENGTMYCSLDDSDDCSHINKLLNTPSVQDLLEKGGWCRKQV